MSILQVLGVDLDVDVLVRFGYHVQRCERGVTPSREIVRRDAHQPVHTFLHEEQAVRVTPADGKGRALYPAAVPGLDVVEVDARSRVAPPTSGTSA